MLNKIHIGLLLLLWLVLPAATLAQDMPSGKWWRIPRVAEQLNLSDEEKGALDELFLDSRRKLIDLKGAVERERLELEIVFEKESLDEPAVMERFKRLEDARANLATERFRFVLEVRKMIGYDRFQSLKTFFTRLRRGRERPGGERSKLGKFDHGSHARQWKE